jgi:ubiquinone/menaquinone biosynthesis C-methylase UbiE
MKKDTSKAFALEEERAKLASSGNFKDLKKTYKKKYPQIPNLNTAVFWDRLNDREFTDHKHFMAYDKLLKVASGIKDENIRLLNVACGMGDLEHFVFNIQKKSKLDWYGMDISTRSIKSCKKIFKNAKFSVGDARKLKFNDKYFGIVTALEILEHISPKNTFKVLKEIKRVLKKDGLLIVSVPLNEGLMQMIKKGENPNAHVRVYTPELIKAELKISGFSIEKIQFLYAFKNLYKIKTLLVKTVLKGYRKPNGIIIFARKK